MRRNVVLNGAINVKDNFGEETDHEPKSEIVCSLCVTNLGCYTVNTYLIVMAIRCVLILRKGGDMILILQRVDGRILMLQRSCTISLQFGRIQRGFITLVLS